MASATGANFLGVTHSIPGGILPGKSKLLYSVLNKTNTAQGGGDATRQPLPWIRLCLFQVVSEPLVIDS